MQIFIENYPVMFYLLPCFRGREAPLTNWGADGDGFSGTEISVVSGFFGSVRGLCDGCDRTSPAFLVSSG